MAYQETLRRDTPGGISGTSTMLEEVTIGGVKIKPGDAFWLSMRSCHYDKDQWRQPELFVPDRFNPDCKEWYLRPNGESRAMYAYIPFFGGPRMCLGMRLAELALKTVIPLWYHFFDFEFVKPEHVQQRPIVEINSSKVIEVPLKVTTRSEVPIELRNLLKQ